MTSKPHSFPKAKGLFKSRPLRFEHENEEKGCKYTIGYISIKDYLKQRHITRNTLKYFVQRKWVLVTKGQKTRISVKELCSDLIDEYLGLS